MKEIATDVLVVGAGLGGVAASLAVLKMGYRVVLTEETAWLGGQATSQAVPPDEHPWIDEVGCTASYAEYRARIRDHYRRNYPLIDALKDDPHLNPGAGFVSPLCHEPRVSLAVLHEMLEPYRSAGRLAIHTHTVPTAVDTHGDQVSAVTLRDVRDDVSMVVTASYVVDATELGDLLELGGVEHVIGAESQRDTGEMHALAGDPDPLDQQAHSWCFALSHHPGEDHVIERPAQYDFWRDYHPSYWPDKQLSWTTSDPLSLAPDVRPIFVGDTDEPRINDLWHFRRILYRKNFEPGFMDADVSVANWPQLDYTLGPLVGVDDEAKARHWEGARQLSLSMVYWMQTEAPRYDGGNGYPGLRLRGDVTGTSHGLAMYPYIRESRRIQAEFTVLEQHVGVEARGDLKGAEPFHDSVGIGSYRIDLHPSTGQRNYVDVGNWPFQIPLGALLPVRVENLLPANKNIGTTHITNGCYRLHPVEWNIGEAAGALAAYCLDKRTRPRHVRTDAAHLRTFQDLLVDRFGVDLAWPESVRVTPRDFPFGTCHAPLRLPVRG